MASDRNIAEILRRDSERTRGVYQAEAEIFKRTVKDVPSGIPHPGGATRIQNVADSHYRALPALWP